MKKVDYIIVGQGIAGTMVAFFAKKAGKEIIVIDQSKPFSASKVSAGLINPITGRKFVKSWRMDDLLPAAIQTYQEFSELLGQNFFQSKRIIRAFSDNKAENNWFVRSSIPSYFQYIQDEAQLDNYENIIKPAFGYGEVKGGGRVEVEKLINSYRNYLIDNDNYLSEIFDYEKLIINEKNVIYSNIEAQKIIFCEGIGIKENIFFNHLPVQGNKGEVLIIQIPNVQPKKIIKQNVFLVPIKDDLFWVGSTYFNDFVDDKPSERGKINLLERLEKVLKIPFKVIEHKAAIRPTVPDRRPLIGLHPKFKPLVLFNGMGTKGASLAPFWANQLISSLEKNLEIDDVVNIKRYGGF